MPKEYLMKYIEYITNTGGSPTVGQFDDDWEPIGPMVRKDLLEEGMITVVDGTITAVEGGPS